MPDTERRAMLAPYEAAFLEGARQGRAEEDIAQSLGDPAVVARCLVEARPESRHDGNGDTSFAGGTPPANGWRHGDYPTPPPGWQNNGMQPPPPARRGCLSSLLIGGIILLLNLCFLLGPVLGVYGLLFGGWCASLGLSVGGVVAFAGSLAASSLPGWVPDSLSMATLLSGSVMMASSGLLLGMGLWHVTRWTIRLTGRYLGWTANLILNKPS